MASTTIHFKESIPCACKMEIERAHRKIWQETKFFQEVEEIQSLVNWIPNLGDSGSRQAFYDHSLVTFWMEKIILGCILADHQT